MSAVEKHFDSITNLSFGPEFLIKLNPVLIMIFLKHLTDNNYKEIILKKLLTNCPGLIDCWLMLSNIQNTKEAHKSLENVLEMDPTNPEAHLMVANLLIKQVYYYCLHSCSYTFIYVLFMFLLYFRMIL